MAHSASGGVYEGEELWPSSSLSAWRADPARTFTDWLARRYVAGARQFRQTSAKTYGAMFHTWHDFLDQRRMHVLEATAQDAAAFFERQGLEPVSRRRYLQLLDKVYRHLRFIGLAGENPFRAELAQETILAERFPEGLSDDDQDRLVSYLEHAQDWKGARDRAMVAVLLGAGLRNNEAVLLPGSAILADYRIHVRPTGVHRDHWSIVLPDGPWREWLDDWRDLRGELNIPGDILCPATLKGKAYSPSGLFRRLAGVFEAASLTSDKRGANVLRNSFAREALLCGRYTVEQVQEFLGHEDIRATTKHVVQAKQSSCLAFDA